MELPKSLISSLMLAVLLIVAVFCVGCERVSARAAPSAGKTTVKATATAVRHEAPDAAYNQQAAPTIRAVIREFSATVPTTRFFTARYTRVEPATEPAASDRPPSYQQPERSLLAVFRTDRVTNGRASL